MTSAARDSRTLRTRIAVLAIAAVVIIAGMVGALVVIERGATDPLPEVNVYVDGQYRSVAPLKYCAIDLSNCVDGEKTHLDAPVGSTVQIGLPPQITDAPWSAIVEYLGPQGSEFSELSASELGTRRSLTIGGRDEHRQLLTIEIRLPSSAVDETGNPFTRAYWSIDLAPASLEG